MPNKGKLILAIDPGTHQSGWVAYRDRKILAKGNDENLYMLTMLSVNHTADILAIEMIQGMNMRVGQEVFDTCVWVGRFMQVWRNPAEVIRVRRREVKMHLCNSVKANDADIRGALIAMLGEPGKKANPGATYGIASHMWPALAVAVTVEAGEHLP